MGAGIIAPVVAVGIATPLTPEDIIVLAVAVPVGFGLTPAPIPVSLGLTPAPVPVGLGLTPTPVPTGTGIPLAPVGFGREPVPHNLNCWSGTFHAWPPTAGNGPSASRTGLNPYGYLKAGLGW